MGFVLTALCSEYIDFSYTRAEKKNIPDRKVCVSLLKKSHFFSHL